MALSTSTSSPSLFASSAVHFSGSLHSRAPATVRLPSRRRTNRGAAAAAHVSERTATARVAPPQSLYDVLGVGPVATCQAIKASYRRLARIVHPDVNATNGQGQSSCYEFMKVHEAYATLSDPERRAHYDLMQRLNCSLAMTGVSRSSNASTYAATRNWESDQCW